MCAEMEFHEYRVNWTWDLVRERRISLGTPEMVGILHETPILAHL